MRKNILVGLAYFCFFLASLVVSLYLTFDPMQVKGYLEDLAQKRGYQIQISELGKYRLSGVDARDVTLRTKSGANFKFDRLQARVALLPLILGKTKVAFQATIYGGKVNGTVEQSKRGYLADFNANDVNLASVQTNSGPWIAAKLNAKGNLNLTPKDNQKKWTGKMNADFGAGKVQSFKFQGFQIPEIKMDRAKLDLELNNGIALIKTLEMQSTDCPVQGSGQVELRDGIASSTLQLKAKVDPSEQFLSQLPALQSLLPADHTVSFSWPLAGLFSR